MKTVFSIAFILIENYFLVIWNLVGIGVSTFAFGLLAYHGKYSNRSLRELTEEELRIITTNPNISAKLKKGLEAACNISKNPTDLKILNSIKDHSKTEEISRINHSINNLSYDVALSFAGEDRENVEKIAQGLKQKGIKVFYDKYEESNLWGKDLYVHLGEIYRNKSRFCIMFLSIHYARKAWANHERKAAQTRAFKENREYILPVKLDDTEIPGIEPTVGYIDLRKKTNEELINLIIKKLGSTEEFIALKEKKSLTSYPLAKESKKVPSKFTGRLQLFKDYVEQELVKHGRISIEDAKSYCKDEIKLKRVKDHKLYIRHLLNDLELVVREPSVWVGDEPLSSTTDAFKFNSGPFELFHIKTYLDFPTDHFVYARNSKEYKTFKVEKTKKQLGWEVERD